MIRKCLGVRAETGAWLVVWMALRLDRRARAFERLETQEDERATTGWDVN